MKKLLAILLFGALTACGSHKARSPERIKESLLKEIPGLNKVDAVNKTKVPNMYEVVVGHKVFYVTDDGKYLVFGNIIDVNSKKSITEERIQELSKIDWNQLPLDLAIKEVNGNGKRKLAVFADTSCPYCQMFEKQIAPNLTDTTIYVFMYPLPNHPNAKSEAKRIWCSKDRTLAWVNWMRNHVALPKDESCDTSALDKIMEIGNTVVQIEGTPTLILENGHVLPGVLPPQQLMEEMDKAALQK